MMTQRGHGRSTPVPGAHGSSGGNTALELAARHPHVPRAIVLLDAGPLNFDEADRPGLLALVEEPRGPAGRQRLADVAAGMLAPGDGDVPGLDLAADSARASASVFAHVIESDLAWDGRAAARACAVPVLAVVADAPSTASAGCSTTP